MKEWFILIFFYFRIFNKDSLSSELTLKYILYRVRPRYYLFIGRHTFQFSVYLLKEKAVKYIFFLFFFGRKEKYKVQEKIDL